MAHVAKPSDTDVAPYIHIALQASNQSTAYRIWKYFSDPPNDDLVPRRVRGEQALEYGPRTDHAGPATVMLVRVGIAASAFMEWFMAATWLKRMVSRVYVMPSHHSQPQYTSCTEEGIVRKIIEAGVPTCALRVQCHPRKAEVSICDELERAGFVFQPHEGSFQAVLNVIQVDGVFWWGYVPACLMYRVSHTVEKVHKGLSSSAVNKLDEAMLVCGMRERQLQACVDIGAAPGAWTEFLARRSRLVIAVDPANLSPQCLALRNVVHIQQQSQRCVPRILQLLHQGLSAADAESGRSNPCSADPVISSEADAANADAATAGSADAALERGAALSLDLVVCDMNQVPHVASAAVVPLLDALSPGGWVVMTCKLFGMGRDKSKVEEAILSNPAFSSLVNKKVLWLLSNTVNERTFVAQKPCTC